MPNPRIGRWLAPLAASLVLAAAWWGWQHFGVAGRATAPDPAGSATRIADSPRDVYFGPPNSVAVLPFATANGESEQVPLARGFTADLLSRLQEVEALRVTAPTSSFFFGSGSVPRRIVSERLQSAYLVSGEWRAGETGLTLAVSVFDGRRGQETWTGDFEGSLDRIGELRDEVASAVVNALPGRPARGWGPSPPVRAQAWVELQHGRYLADPLGSLDLEAAKARLTRALELQPDLHAARLALAEIALHPVRRETDAENALAYARAAVDDVLGGDAAAVDRARALALRSHLEHQYDWRWQQAAEAAEAAVALRPGDARLLALAGLTHFTLGEFALARERLQASISRDPLNLASRLQLGLAEEFSGMYDEALASYRRLLALREGYPAAHAFRARVKALQGKGESAAREAEQESDPFWRRYARTLALFTSDRTTEAGELLQQIIVDDGDRAAFQVAELYAIAGDAERALEWLERARTQRDGGLSAMIGNPLLERLQGESRWHELLLALGLPADIADR